MVDGMVAVVATKPCSAESGTAGVVPLYKKAANTDTSLINWLVWSVIGARLLGGWSALTTNAL